MPSTALNFDLDKPLCTRCELCSKDCPASVIELDDFGFPHVTSEREAKCFFCQHCMAICPEGAISIRGIRPENSQRLAPELLPRFEQMDHLVRARRSVRQYRQENVDLGLIQRLLDAIANAPTGVNARQLTFTVIEERSVLAALRERVIATLSEVAHTEQFAQRAEFLANVVNAWRVERRDMIFRNAPHLLIVSAPPTMRTPHQDVPLTLAYFELLAQSAGLGTVWLGYFRLIFDALPALKRLVSLAEDDIYYAMLFGYPAVQYARTVQREGSAQIRRVSSIEG